MSWRMVEIECFSCKKIIGWHWADWTDNPLLANEPTSTLCDDCLSKVYPMRPKKTLKPNPLEGRTEP